MSVFDLPEYLAWPDWQQWEPVTKWLGSKKSLPA
jgi:chromosome partitioning protein